EAAAAAAALVGVLLAGIDAGVRTFEPHSEVRICGGEYSRIKRSVSVRIAGFFSYAAEFFSYCCGPRYLLPSNRSEHANTHVASPWCPLLKSPFSDTPLKNTSGKLALMQPCRRGQRGCRQEASIMQRIRGLRPGSWTMLSSSCSSSERGSTSPSGELGAVGGAFGVIAAGAKSRRSNSVCVFCSTTNSYGDVNTKTSSTGLACDQCGDTFYSAASLSPSPLEPPLAVCRAPGCGVAFSQCPRCKVEYVGCCSAACQTLAAEEGAPRIAAAVVVEEVVMVEGFDKRGRRAKHESPPLNRDSYDEEEEEEELVAVGVARSAASTEGSTLAIVPEIRAVVGAAAGGGGTPPSKQEPVQSGRRKGGDKNAKAGASFTTPRGGVSDAGSGAEGGGGGKGKRKRGRDGETDEPSLESYASRHSEPESPCLSDVRESTIRAQPGGAHMVSGHLQGGVLKLLAKLSGAKRVLDVGTFTGYSALAFAEALPGDGVVVTLESDARAAETARGHFDSSEHGGKIRLLLGRAMDGIDQLIAEDAPQFDMIFIDADKKRYWDYYEKVLAGPRPLLAPAGMLLADNVLFHELVPLAEAMGTAAAAAATATAAGTREISPQERENKPLGGGVLVPTPRRLKIAESLDGFNKRVREDERVEVLMLPLRDGLSVVTWRTGGYP
ncbi:unnamed protein product, partial [Pylaiella littoralis]